MPRKRLPMRKINEVLRLKAAGLGNRRDRGEHRRRQDHRLRDPGPCRGGWALLAASRTTRRRAARGASLPAAFGRAGRAPPAAGLASRCTAS